LKSSNWQKSHQYGISSHRTKKLNFIKSDLFVYQRKPRNPLEEIKITGKPSLAMLESKEEKVTKITPMPPSFSVDREDRVLEPPPIAILVQ
jgi:hypothetical protein